MNFLICLVGLPASGKSTFAQILKDNLSIVFRDREIIIIDPDLIRKSLTNNDFDSNKEKIVRENNLNKISSALREGKIVISDDLNYYTSMRHDLKSIADSLSLHFFIIYVATSLKTCLNWNQKRGRKIPDKIIEKIYEKFDFFNKYRWDAPFYEFDPSKLIDVRKCANEIISKILEKLNKPKLANEKELNQKISSNILNERLERITRQTVGNLLKNSRNTSLKEKILELRKEFLKYNRNISLTESEIAKNLIQFLEEVLHRKLS